jgi:hypothetical protein
MVTTSATMTKKPAAALPPPTMTGQARRSYRSGVKAASLIRSTTTNVMIAAAIR